MSHLHTNREMRADYFAFEDHDMIEHYRIGDQVAFWIGANKLEHGGIKLITRRGLVCEPDIYWIDIGDDLLVPKPAKHIIKRPKA